MASINDIPEQLRTASARQSFLDWLAQQQIGTSAKRHLMKVWRIHTDGKFTASDYIKAGAHR